jgi:hypothetical protein
MPDAGALEAWLRAHAHPAAARHGGGAPAPTSAALTHVSQLLSIGSGIAKVSAPPQQLFGAAKVSEAGTTRVRYSSFPREDTVDTVVGAAVTRAQHFTHAQVTALSNALSPHRWVAVDQLSSTQEVGVCFTLFFCEDGIKTWLCRLSRYSSCLCLLVPHVHLRAGPRRDSPLGRYWATHRSGNVRPRRRRCISVLPITNTTINNFSNITTKSNIACGGCLSVVVRRRGSPAAGGGGDGWQGGRGEAHRGRDPRGCAHRGEAAARELGAREPVVGTPYKLHPVGTPTKAWHARAPGFWLQPLEPML